ncbi:MAG: pyrroline-5-carboxylate reductase [Magnetococcales bacterium]|nr:pyrroline-5-carboxylate reductase [Magnetococcales bacterium]
MTTQQFRDTIVSFAGGGNMATALIQGLIRSGFQGGNIRLFEPDASRAQALQQQFGIVTAPSNTATLNGSRVLVLAVKPGIIGAVLREVAPHLSRDTLVISIAAGITLASLTNVLPPRQPVIRAMPNTPALIQAGVTVLCPGDHVNEEQRLLGETLLKTVGDVRTVSDESVMDAVTALSGSGPAYVYLILEALSDGGVACGLPRDMATWLALHTVQGAARLVQETGQHPGVLKNQVTSPGGTTIAALKVLEEAGMRGTLMRAVEAAWRRSRELSGPSSGH